MKPIKVAEGVYNVGVRDWNIRDFHGYSVPFGTTYNAFLIMDEKITLVDTVKQGFINELMENISQIVDPAKIDIVISNHAEMDHSGSLPMVMHRIGKEKPVFCSKMGLKNLNLHFHKDLNLQPVANGSTMSLGKKSLTFLETRMIHWPDSMFSYLAEDKILFSSDGFGQHYAGREAFDDEIGDEVMHHAKKYFANILMLYAPKILKLVDEVKGKGLEINTICPDHGIIWRKDPSRIISAYERWSHQESKKKAVVIYDTMWHSTEKMADKIIDGLIDEGIDVKPMHLRKWHRSDIMTEVLDAKAIVVGSPTLNNQLFPTVADILTYMKGLKPKDKIGGAFGSYGWSGESVKFIIKELEAMKFEIADPGVRIQYVPGAEGLSQCYEYGKKIGQAISDS